MRQLRHPAPDEITLPRVLGALSDPARLAIVAKLADGREHPWSDLDVGVGPSTLSHHVRVLREAGIINHRKEGTRCFVALRPDLEDVFPGLLSSVLKFAKAKDAHSRAR